MLIVSQDEKCMTEDLNIYIKIHNPNFGEVIYAIENDEFVLGEYKTEERAKEVLKEIAKKYENSMWKLGKNTLSFQDEFVYEMPKQVIK